VIASIIVFGSIVFAAGFCFAWLVRPEVRAWLETPKHRFQASVRQYDLLSRGQTPAQICSDQSISLHTDE
jgi:hypothetical protein